MKPVYVKPDDFENGEWEGPLLRTKKQRVIAAIITAFIFGLVFF